MLYVPLHARYTVQKANVVAVCPAYWCKYCYIPCGRDYVERANNVGWRVVDWTTHREKPFKPKRIVNGFEITNISYRTATLAADNRSSLTVS